MGADPSAACQQASASSSASGLARDDKVSRWPVALKQVLPDGPDSAAWECALGEARAAAHVDHVGAVTAAGQLSRQLRLSGVDRQLPLYPTRAEALAGRGL